MVTAAHGCSQFKKNHQCVVGREGIGYLMEEIESMEVGEGNVPLELSLTGRNATTKASTSRPYSVRVWYFARRRRTISVLRPSGPPHGLLYTLPHYYYISHHLRLEVISGKNF
ncbi:hypothetical protein EVAR_81536_1 [Eumeta japonica]|uniref:Uncharacterized protein n=1 Tax=Eumeta variegata TaxID=151549 RepID=A0A4C1UZ83_EUMVA|nr:hypothetical protein EVAR_81536_1 [Eumeta japonica]